MIIEIAIKLFFVIFGIFLIVISSLNLKKNAVSLTFGFLWILFGIILVLLGLLMRPTGWLTIMGLTSLLLLGLTTILLVCLIWTILKSIDKTKQEVEKQRRNIQHLQDENYRLKNAIASINNKALFNSNAALYTKLNTIKNSSVLFVINTMGMGGAEKQLIETLNDFTNNGNDVDLFVITSQGELISQVPENVNILNDSFDEVSVLNKEGQKLLKKKVISAELHHGNIFRFLPYQIVCFFKMIQSGKLFIEKLLWLPLAMACPSFDKKYDYAIAYTEGAATQYLAKKVNANVKYSFVHIVYDIAGYNDFLDNGAYESINKIFAVSNEVRNSFVRVHPECNYKTFIVENEIDTAEILNKAQEFKVDKSETSLLVSMGRLTNQKGFEKSILAASMLKKNGFDFKWIILGDGPLMSQLQELINKHELNDFVILKGKVENPYPYLKACDIFVHATEYEGKSIALREAKILGCVTVVSDVEGNRETVIDGFDGLMCQPNPDDIFHKISMIINDEKFKEYLRNNISITE